MKRIFTSFIFSLLTLSFAFAGGYKVGDKAADFSLKSVDGKMVSLKDFTDAKGVVIIFTSNHCSTSKDYEDLFIKLDKKYKELGYHIVAINPTDPEVNPKESHAHMVMRAEKKGFTFPYLSDDKQSVARAFGATKIPEAFLLEKVGDDFIVRYTGMVDVISDFSATDKSLRYLSNAIDALLEGQKPDPAFTKPEGCRVNYTAE